MRVGLNLEQLLHHPPGGIGSYTAELARLLPEQGGEPVDVVGFVARHTHAEIDAALTAFALTSQRLVRLPLPRPVLYDAWNLLRRPTLASMSKDLRGLDLVHAPSLAVPPHPGVPLVVTVHDAAPLLFPDAYPRRGRWFHQRGFAATALRADVVIAPSAAAAAEIAEHTTIRPERMRVVHQGVHPREVSEASVEATRTSLGLGQDPFVLWVGTLEPRKNLEVLVEAFRRFVAASDLSHHLVLIGPSGWLNTAETIKVPARALGDRVHFTGPVTGEHLAALYRSAELFAFPSFHEGFGIPVLEAMAQSTAVLCSGIPVMHEVAGDAAAFAAPHDPEAWAAELMRLLSDDAARNALAVKGFDRTATFTWDACIARTLAVYQEAISA